MYIIVTCVVASSQMYRSTPVLAPHKAQQCYYIPIQHCRGGNGSWWWIMDTQRLTYSGDMLICQV